jgi:hypothetical protein
MNFLVVVMIVSGFLACLKKMARPADAERARAGITF